MLDDNPFSVLPRKADPPPALRGRVLSDLRHRRLVPRGPSPLLRGVIGLAAALVVFLAGLMVGGRASAVVVPPGQPYVLLLYSSERPDVSISHEAVAAEYRSWAEGLGGRFLSGDALGEQRLLGGASGVEAPTGYFIIRAADWDDAMAIARGCPHLRHGGVVAVHAIIN